MISRVNGYSATPSFGMAKLSQTGKDAAERFGIQSNEFLRDDLFRRQWGFRKSALATEIKAGRPFKDICEEYGCSSIGRSNAAFIETQILSGKSDKALKSLPKETLEEGLVALYLANYDNPDLPKNKTRALLEKIKAYMAPELYIQNLGLLNEAIK